MVAVLIVHTMPIVSVVLGVHVVRQVYQEVALLFAPLAGLLRHNYVIKLVKDVGRVNGSICLSSRLTAEVLTVLVRHTIQVILRQLKPIRRWVDGFLGHGCGRRRRLRFRWLLGRRLVSLLLAIRRLGVARPRPHGLDEERITVLARALVILIHGLD